MRLPYALRAAVAAAAVLLASCGHISQGNQLVSIRFTSATNALVPQTTRELFQCFAQQLTLIGEFTDHTLGNFTTRGAVYSSSDPTKVQVSNGDIPAPGGTGFYARGVVIPVEPSGPVVITASYATLTASIQVSVSPIDPIKVTPADAYMAPGSNLRFTATTMVDGNPLDVSTSGAWVVDAPQSGIASINPSSGVATAGSAPGDITARLSVPLCQGSATDPTASATATIHVAAPDHLEVTRQFPGQPILFATSPNSYATTDAITTLAVFPGGQTEDLSTQAVLQLTPPDSGTLLVQNTNLLRSVAEGTPVTVSSFYNSAGTLLRADLPQNNTAGQPLEQISVRNATLDSIAISPGDQNPTIPTFGTYPFHAIGTFTGDDGLTYTQDITRHVAWSSSDATVVMSNIYSGSLLLTGGNGTATSTADQGVCAQITADTGVPATDGSGNILATTTLAVVPGVAAQPGSPANSPCRLP
ncbi:MAG TPA: hypothetical protein VHE37_03695 [Nevskiaceae bacterium]|nr:hypothetical protein [Nevskiaceae bacterium]